MLWKCWPFAFAVASGSKAMLHRLPNSSPCFTAHHCLPRASNPVAMYSTAVRSLDLWPNVQDHVAGLSSLYQREPDFMSSSHGSTLLLFNINLWFRKESKWKYTGGSVNVQGLTILQCRKAVSPQFASQLGALVQKCVIPGK